MTPVAADDLPDDLAATAVPADDLPDFSPAPQTAGAGRGLVNPPLVDPLSPTPRGVKTPRSGGGGSDRGYYGSLYKSGSLTQAAQAVTGALLEAPVVMAAGAGMSALGGIGGLARAGAGMAGLAGKPGETFDESMSAGADVANSARSMAYQPRTAGARGAFNMAGSVLEAGNHALGSAGETAGGVVGPKTAAFGRTLGENAIDTALAATPLAGAAKGLRTPMPPSTFSQGARAIKDAQSKGFYATPSRANPSAINKLMESLAGRAAVEDTLALEKNVPAVNAKARSAINLSADADLDAHAFETFRTGEEQKYVAVKAHPTPVALDDVFKAEVKNLDKDFQVIKEHTPELAKSSEVDTLSGSLLQPKNPEHPGMYSAEYVIEMSKRLRKEATIQMRSDDPARVAGAFAKRQAATSLEDLLDRNLEGTATPDLVKNFREARKNIAQSHDLEAATNLVTGDVNPQILARLAKDGPLSGNLKDIADAAMALKNTMKNPDKLHARSTVQMGDLGAATVIGHLAKHGVAAKTAIALGIRPAARKLVTSKLWQNTMAKPSSEGGGGSRIPMSSAAPAVIPGTPALQEEEQQQ